ncbi:MAG TPA: efflux RND transporter periplasmic adaptor subunit [Anaerolineae bacterium]
MRRFLVPGIIVFVVVAGALLAYFRLFRPASTKTTTQQGATATVQLGALAATVNAAGNINSHQVADLSFGTTGTVKKINVKVGDRVKAGAVLAELDSADLNLQLRNAQVNLKVSQDKLAQTKNPNTSQDIANARAQLDAAQANYDKVAAGPSQSDLASAQAQVTSAQASYDAAVKSAGTAGNSLVSAAAALEKARVALETAQASYDKISWRGDAAASQQAQTLQSATIDYQSAKSNYDTLAATNTTDTNSKVAQAQSGLQSAQANLAKVRSQVTAADLASAQSQLTQAKNNLDKLLAGADANTLDIAQNSVEQAQIALDQAKLKVQQAQLTAPFDSVVTQINIRLGQNGSTSAIQVADLDHLEIVVNMAEVDVNRLKLGQTAQITLDAVPDAALDGTVSLIAPAGTLTQGVVNYPVTISLNKPPEGVKTGMTANLNVIIDQRSNVLVVPNRAIRTVNRQKVVSVLFEGQTIQVPVQTGLSNDSMTEITSGLKEGDTVLLSTTTTTGTNRGGFGGGPGGPGIRVFGGGG